MSARNSFLFFFHALNYCTISTNYYLECCSMGYQLHVDTITQKKFKWMVGAHVKKVPKTEIYRAMGLCVSQFMFLMFVYWFLKALSFSPTLIKELKLLNFMWFIIFWTSLTNLQTFDDQAILLWKEMINVLHYLLLTIACGLIFLLRVHLLIVESWQNTIIPWKKWT